MPNQLLNRPPDEDDHQEPLLNVEFDPNRLPRKLIDKQYQDWMAKARSENSKTPEEIGSAENLAGAGSRTALSPAEESLVPKDSLYNPSDKGSFVSRAAGLLRSQITKRRAIIGGASLVAAVIAFFLFLGVTSFEAIHVRENMLGRFGSNRRVYAALQRRRAKSFARQMRLLSQGKLRNLDVAALNNRLVKQGFEVELDEGRTKITRLSYTKDGITRSFDFNETSLDVASNNFFGNASDKLGLEIASKLDSATHASAKTWRGRAARKVYTGLKVRLRNWLDPDVRAPPEADTPQEKFQYDYKKAAIDDGVAIASLSPGGRTANDINQQEGTDYDNDGDIDSEASSFPGLEGADEAIRQLQDVNNLDPADDIIRNNVPEAEGLDVADAIADSPGGFGSLLNTDLNTSSLRGFVNTLRSRLGSRLAGRLDNIAGTAVGAVNFAEYGASACRVKGTINFIANVQNVLVAYQLATFTLRFLTAADHQKAGIIQSEGLAVMMSFMHLRSTSGKVYHQSGGFQREIMGNTRARASDSHLALYSTSRTPSGIFGFIHRFINSLPVPLDSSNCRFYNNGFVQLGGAALGIAVAIFSGGTVTAGQIASGLAIGLAQEVAFAVGTPLVLRAVANSVVDGYIGGEAAGSILASGWGGLRGMNAGALGLMPSSRRQVGELDKNIEVAKAQYRDEQSIFSRYLDLGQYDSLASQMAFALPTSTSLSPQSLWSQATDLMSFRKIGNLFGNVLPGTSKVYAQEAEAQSCPDPQVVEHDLETDSFCNIEMAHAPDLNTDETEQMLLTAGMINDSGDPVDTDPSTGAEDANLDVANIDYNDYIDLCFSGRPGIAYAPNVSQDGINNPNLDVCITGGTNLPEDSVPRGYRYADMYGSEADEADNIEDINGEPEASPQGTTGNNSATTPTDVAGNLIVGDPYTDSTSVACAAGTEDIGIHDGYVGGNLVKMRICKLPNLPSAGRADIPNGEFTIPGGAGHARVNSRVSGAWFALVNDAATDGINLTSVSSFRTMAHQQTLCNEKPECVAGDNTWVAEPGYSSHQAGVAIDFDNGMLAFRGGDTCATRARAPSLPAWQWLYDNAHRYGFKQYAPEAWHWDAQTNSCGPG